MLKCTLYGTYPFLKYVDVDITLEVSAFMISCVELYCEGSIFFLEATMRSFIAEAQRVDPAWRSSGRALSVLTGEPALPSRWVSISIVIPSRWLCAHPARSGPLAKALASMQDAHEIKLEMVHPTACKLR